MTKGSKRALVERSSTDDSLRIERRKTDTELARRSESIEVAAAGVLTEARLKADEVLSDAREREDLKVTVDQSVEELRAREDAALEGARTGADAVVRDESERRYLALASLLAFEREDTDLRLEIERDRIDKALSSREDFMAMVSHDLRSLLGGIALSAELLKGVANTADPSAKVNEYAVRIQRCSARMNRLIGDLMDAASIDAGRLALVRTARRATLLLRDALEAFEPAARAQGIELRYEVAADPGVVELDHERMLQVLANLVGNALKFTPRGGRIVLGVERRGDDVCFSVADSGEGIAADKLETIFDRYTQLHAADRRGLGLGLFIAKSIIQGHGGRIWAESTPGQGSTFYFTVPSPAASQSRSRSCSSARCAGVRP